MKIPEPGGLAREAYEHLVAEFREVTRAVGPSGRCCEKVRDGVPECCYQIIDGAELTFTERELQLLPPGPVLSEHLMRQGELGEYVLDREFMPAAYLEEVLHTGWLARTLECASHPTRPLLIDGATPRVWGVAVVDCCNARVSDYGAQKERLIRMWQTAVDLCGVKMYYGRWGIRDDWKVL